METHKIDQLFKQKLDRHSEVVSADAFAKMQAQMKGKKQKKGFPWMIAASISILLIVSFGIAYNYNQNTEQNFAQLDLNQSSISLNETGEIRFPELQQETQTQVDILQKQISAPIQKSTPIKVESQDLSRMATLDKVNAFKADIRLNMVPELRLAPKVDANKVIVEIHYTYAESKEDQNIIEKSNKKLKSLASEFSLAELRSAKNELFASALQFNKKGNN
ncbi:hypothetical protein [uncultured Marivirga sp.]|uniref:hypothetical protein n=1 Tax=uncultured Marivirga sp. TaxID=1123707 RepID=UPI0030EBE6DC|tara:strand:+ start:270410 stop:271069 length:660 start_codon:yes stop_codon:yes gene_type:complete